MQLKRCLSLILLLPGFLLIVTACGTSSTASNSTPTTSANSTSTAVVTSTASFTPTATSTFTDPQMVVTPTPVQNWKTYQSAFFTIRYPANWIANVIQPGPNGGIYAQQVIFRPSSTSAISFTIGALYNGEVSPDILLQNDPLYKSCRIESQSKVTIDGILWSTATGQTQGSQLAPAKVEIAYANHKHPYRVSFSTPPSQFAANSKTLNAMFQSFQER